MEERFQDIDGVTVACSAAGKRSEFHQQGNGALEEDQLVIATASPRDVEAVRGPGAQEVIDHRAVRFEDAVNGIDAVIDLVGGEVQARSFAVLRPGGILVSAVSQPDQEVAARHGVRALFFLVNVTTAHLTRIAEMIEAGDLAVNVGTVLPLHDAREAHEMLEGLRSRPRGKIVLTVGE